MTTNNDKSGSRLRKSKIQHPRKQRQLKVREAYHSYQLSQNALQRTRIGEIQLKGNWLIEAGFTIDSPVTVRVMDGCLVLTTELCKNEKTLVID